jgi:hypothetical protein
MALAPLGAMAPLEMNEELITFKRGYKGPVCKAYVLWGCLVPPLRPSSSSSSSPRIKRLGPPFSAEVGNERNSTSTTPIRLYGLLRDTFYLIFAPSFCPNKPPSFSFWRFFIDGLTQLFPICERTVSCHTDFRKKRKHPSNQIIFREISGLSYRFYVNCEFVEGDFLCLFTLFSRFRTYFR